MTLQVVAPGFNQLKPRPTSRRKSYDINIFNKDIPLKAPFLLGRLLFGGFFLYNGIHHLRRRKEMAGYAQAKGVPSAERSVALTSVPLIVGGTSIMLGLKPKI